MLPTQIVIAVVLIGVVIAVLYIGTTYDQLKDDQNSDKDSPHPASDDSETVPTAPVEIPSADSPTQVLSVPQDADESTQIIPVDPDKTLAHNITDMPEPVPQLKDLSRLRWQVGGFTHVGQRRDHNEDNWGHTEIELADGTPCGLYIVADGMGGHQRGEVASQIVIETAIKNFHYHPPVADDEAIKGWVSATVEMTNDMVIAQQESDNPHERMGSTMVLAVVCNNRAHIGNVGDSRAYRLTDDKINRITRDHSLVEKLIELGQITEEEARTHPQRNVIYSTIGDRDRLHLDYYTVDLTSGERLLLCSDGLSGMVDDEHILSISHDYDIPERACQQLIVAANHAGGLDNVTAVIVQFS